MCTVNFLFPCLAKEQIVNIILFVHKVKMTDGSSGITDALGDELASSMIQLFWHSVMVNKDQGFGRLYICLYAYLLYFNMMFDVIFNFFFTSIYVFTQPHCHLSVASGGEKMRSTFFPSSDLSITFAFKVEDKMGLMHRFTSSKFLVTGTHNFTCVYLCVFVVALK